MYEEEEKPGIERRKFFRLDMEKELIGMVWTDENDTEHQKTIECVDFSRGGLKVLSDERIEKNTLVKVIFKSADLHSQRLYAKVLRCVEINESEFAVALLLVDDAP